MNTVAYYKEHSGYGRRLAVGVTLGLKLKSNDKYGLWIAHIDGRGFKNSVMVVFDPHKIYVDRESLGDRPQLWIDSCSIELTEGEADEIEAHIAAARAAMEASA